MAVSARLSARGLPALEARLGHKFHDRALLRRALRHASAGGESNERLEFLGDRVLGLIVAERLHTEYPHEAEGALAVRLNALVRREACARAAENADLAPHIVMAPSELASGGRRKAAILANACEAVIAALFIDGGLETARKFVLRYWESALAASAPDLRDAKTALQEWAQSGALNKKVQPDYKLEKREGPDHAPRFTVAVKVAGRAKEMGEGASKREAEQSAARRLLLRLGVWKE